MKFNLVCDVCGKEFEKEIETNDKYYTPPTAICSDECQAKVNEEYFQKRILILPKRFRTIESDQRKLVEQGIKESFFITGPTGIGKTVLMATIAMHILKDKTRQVKWIDYAQWIMDIQGMFQNDGNPYAEIKEIEKFPDTLAIDDLGAEKMTPFVQQVTYAIIDYREKEMLHTLITSNFTLKQIAEQIDQRISSRICGLAQTIILKGKDRRVKGDKGVNDAPKK